MYFGWQKIKTLPVPEASATEDCSVCCNARTASTALPEMLKGAYKKERFSADSDKER